MMGNTYTKCDGNPCISWGAHQNLTFDKILEMVYTNHNLETQSHDYIPSPINNSVYLPGFGLCSEISDFDLQWHQKVYIFPIEFLYTYFTATD